MRADRLLRYVILKANKSLVTINIIEVGEVNGIMWCENKFHI